MRFISLILCILMPLLGGAATIIVTSVADNGPGSLRAAIEQANSNGTAVEDVIQFNLPNTSFFDHVIILDSELPTLTSNITIDGSTQPGETFKITTARVGLKFEKYASTFSMFRITNASNVKIYGLYIYIGYDNFFDNTIPIRSNDLYGITITNSSSVDIGAPGKGNIINGCEYGIFSNSGTNNQIRIRSNYIGLGGYYDPPVGLGVGTDISTLVFPCAWGIKFLNVSNIHIGGPDPADGNVITGQRGITVESNKATGNGVLLVQNNKFQKWYDKIFDIGFTYAGTNNLTFQSLLSNPLGVDYEFKFLDNFANAQVRVVGFSKFFEIKRNLFDVPPPDTRHAEKLTILSCSAGGVIGGDSPSDANEFVNRYGYGDYPVRCATNGPVQILKNEFRCNQSYRSALYVEHSNASLIPFVQVDQTTASSVLGRATPNARIDLYYDDACTACEGEIFIATVMADPSGNWRYNGSINGTVVATATTSSGYTGEFSQPRFNLTNMVVVQPSCGLSNGSVKGISWEGAETYYWLNLTTRDTVSRTVDLINVPSGEYLLFARHGAACISPIGESIRLSDFSPHIDTNYRSIKQPSCGAFNGAIGNLGFSSSYFDYKWVNSNNETISNSADISHLGPGKYSFIVHHKTTPQSCSDTVSFELVNLSGPSLDLGSLQIKSATCFNADGSITGIKSVNSMGFEAVYWEDSTGQVVGQSFDLINVPAGKYRMKYKDRTACDTIMTPYYVVASPVLNFIAPEEVEIRDADCGQSAGAVTIHSFNNDIAGYTFRWFNQNNRVVASQPSANDLPAGTYRFYVEDLQGCGDTILTATIKAGHGITIDARDMKILHDQCDNQLASVSGLKISGIQGNAIYTWFDVTGVKRGGEQVLDLVGSGVYRLEVMDDKGCKAELRDVVISNFNPAIPSPEYDDVFVPRNSAATLKPANVEPVLYQVFSDIAATTLVSENETGMFETPVLSHDAAYYVRAKSGSCVSALVRVQVIMVDESFFTIPSAFTPNRDGLNDYLELRFHGRIEVDYFKVFNRYGQVIFSSNKAGDKWDGKIGGKDAAPGVYVWSAKGRDLLGKSISANGTVVLLR